MPKVPLKGNETRKFIIALYLDISMQDRYHT
jgi:hypothetical protein